MKKNKRQQLNNEYKSNNFFVKSINYIENIFYYIILIPLVIIALSLVYQSITKPKEIPNIFGWKVFMILDKNMDESVGFGDLVFAKIIDTNALKTSDLISFRTPLEKYS